MTSPSLATAYASSTSSLLTWNGKSFRLRNFSNSVRFINKLIIDLKCEIIQTKEAKQQVRFMKKLVIDLKCGIIQTKEA